MSSCLSGGGRAYRIETLDLEIIKSPSTTTSWISNHSSSSPSSTLSESSNCPLAIYTRKPRTPRKRPNQTYNEAAAILSTAYPKIFPSHPFSKLHDHTKNPALFEPSDLLMPFRMLDNSGFLLDSPSAQRRPAVFEPKGFNLNPCQSPGEINSSEICNEFRDEGDFDAESMLDEEIEGGIESIMGSTDTGMGNDPNPDCNPYSNANTNNFCYGYPVGLGFEFGYGMRRQMRAMRNGDECDWWRFPCVNIVDICPKIGRIPAEKKKNNKVEIKGEKQNSGGGGEEGVNPPPIAGLLLKLNYDSVLNDWSDKGCPFPGDSPAAQSAGKDVQGRASLIELWENENGGVRDSSVQRYKEKRRTRLFSKKIRYQVRKVNADHRPRRKFDAVKSYHMLKMPGAAKAANREKLHIEDDERTLLSMKRELKLQNKNRSSLSKSKVCKSLHGGKKNISLKRKRKVANKTIVRKNVKPKKKPSLSGHKDKPSKVGSKKREKTDERDVMHAKPKRRRKKRKKNVDPDEASRLQRRTRYLLIKVKLEQNLIDAYSTEGWKGQSKEKIKPENELQRAKKQILKCKLGIREAIHQLDLLSFEGCIDDSAVAPDGSVHHEHIICAKCKLSEALPENDIILCDGSCNRAFHQKCLDPPMSTENIPPGDEGWFCKFCKKKIEILEATNAHLGTHFPLDSSWQDVFKEEASLPDGGNSMLCQEEEWPSDDSEDDDYDPDRIERSCSGTMSSSESEASDLSSSFLGSLELSNGSFDKTMEFIGVDSDEINNGEVVGRPRKRACVDYIKLYDEMFGKNASENEQISDDEDWGPTKKKRKVKDTDAASTLMTLGETGEKNSEVTPSELKETQLINRIKRPIFRLPHNAVEKLRLTFAENELPERALRVSLSRQLGLEFEKVNKWFKNARYLALKARKQAENAQVSQGVSLDDQKESSSQSPKGAHDQIESRNNITAASPKISKMFSRRRNSHLLTHSLKKKKRRKPLLPIADSNQMNVDLGDDVSLKHLREKAKEAKKKLKSKSRGCLMEAEKEMERLCEIKLRVEKIRQILLQLPCLASGKASSSKLADPSVFYIPIAEIKEKR